MSSHGFSLCCVDQDGKEDLFWFSQEPAVTETVAREKFRHHAAIILPEIGLRLYARDTSLRGKRLIEEQLGLRQVPGASRLRQDGNLGSS